MNRVYADLIMKGRKTIDEVPAKNREAVRQILIGSGYPELAESEGATK